MAALLRLLIVCGAAYLIYTQVKGLFLPKEAPRPTRAKGRKQTSGVSGVPMVEDPECGRFISEQEAVQISFRGKTIYFCSSECRDAYTHSESGTSSRSG